jgi:hypothetical protein
MSTGTIRVHPESTGSFTATAYSPTQINLTWAKFTGDDRVVVRFSAVTYPANIADGSLLYNGTATHTEHSGLSPGDHMYYSAWGYNSTANLYSIAHQADDALTNNPPVFGTPSPTNGAIGQEPALTWSIPISDPEGDDIDYRISCSNGEFIDVAGANNGTKSLAIVGPLDFLTVYTIWVNATDSGSGAWTRDTFTFTTREGTTSLAVAPATYSFGPMRLNEEKTSSVITFTNNGENTLSIVNISVSNITGGTLVWDVGSVVANNTFIFAFYNGSSWINITGTPATVLSSIASSGMKSCRIRIHTPNVTSYPRTGVVTGKLHIMYVDGDVGWINYTFSIYPAPSISTGTLGIMSTSNIVFEEGGILSSDIFYVSIPANMSEDTKLEIPHTYSKKYWVFWRQDATVNSIKVYGITNDWSFVPITFKGDVTKTITLNIDHIEDWAAFVVVPNPGFFQSSGWWFDTLNNVQDIFIKGESLATEV